MIRLLASIGLLAALIIGAWRVPTPTHAQTAQDVCLARWEWNATEEFWSAPFRPDFMGALDMRDSIEPATPGPLVLVPGWGFFSYSQPMAATGMHCLGGDINRPLTIIEQNTIRLILELPPGATRTQPVAATIADLLVNHGDPLGATRWRPAQTSPHDGLSIYLQGFGRIYHQPFSQEGQPFANTLDIRMVDYRLNAQSGVPLTTLEKWTGSDMLLYEGRLGDDLLIKYVPPEYVSPEFGGTGILGDHRWRSPETTFSDTFVEVSSDTALTSHTPTPSGGYSWSIENGGFTVIASTDRVSNDNGNSTTVVARADGDLSTSTLYAQAADWNNEVGTTFTGVAGRYASAANTGYLYWHKHDGNESRLEKMVAGTRSNIAIATDSVTGGSGKIARIEVGTNSQEGFYDGASRVTGGDTQITTGFRGGLSGFANGVTRNVWDDFETGDLGAAAASRVIIVD